MAAKERMDRFQTGGGPVETVTTDLDAKVLALLGNSAKPQENCYDSDAQCTISSASGMYSFIYNLHGLITSAKEVMYRDVHGPK